MKRLQSFYLYSYRLTGFIFLLGLIVSILWYGFSILFFSASTSWSVPLILSPNQEKVITHLEHMLNFEHQLTEDITQLKTAKIALETKLLLLKKTNILHQRFTESILAQTKRYTNKSESLQQLTLEKNETIENINSLASQIKHREMSIAQELQSGLITKQEALKERLSITSLHNHLIDAKARSHELNQRAIDFANAADTLDGAASSLFALQNVVKKNELDIQIAELKIDTYSLKVTIEHLERVIKTRQDALEKMRRSPYILAINQSTWVAFVPYTNLHSVTPGSPVYSCYLDMIFCYKSGVVTDLYSAEEYGKHPIFKSEVKGQLIRIAYIDEKDARKKLLFINSKPLMI